MPNSTEQKNTSDDLIAELARLMAEEAQGDRAVDPQSASLPPDRGGEGDGVVRIPGARPTGTATIAARAPAGSMWGRGLDAPAPANSDRIAAEPLPYRVEPVLSDAPRAPSPVEVDDEAFLSALNTSALDAIAPAPLPRHDPAADRFDFTATRGDAEPASIPNPLRLRSAEPGVPVDDPIAAIIAEQERTDALFTAGMPAGPATSRPADATRPSAPEAAAHTPQRGLFGRGGEAHPPTARAPDVTTPRANPPAEQAEDDVLALINAMNGMREREEPAPSEPGGERDRFIASPILGRNAPKPTPAPRSADPLDEIESLIGDAVRLSRDDTRRKGDDWPIEPSLDDAATAAEARIAAAAAETQRPARPSHRPGWTPPDDGVAPVGPATAAPDVLSAEARPVRFGGNRIVIGAAAAATVLVAVALGVYWVFGIGGEPAGPVPVLTSNTGDAKQEAVPPETPAATTQPVIFNEMSGTPAPAADEQIVSRDQSDEVASDIRQVATAETAEESLANRKVRTVTVRPDGSIVSNDETVAANDVLPVVRPNVPTLPDGGAATGDFQVSAATPTETTAPTADAATAVATAPDPIASIVNDAVAPDAAAATPVAADSGELVQNAPYPAMRPSASVFAAPAATTVAAASPTVTPPTTAAGGSGQTIDLISDIANQVASQLPATTPGATTTAPTTVAAVEPTASGPSAAAYVQLSSQRNMDAANATLATMNQRYQGLFNGQEAFVRRVDLGDLGIFYRVLVPAGSLADASGVCASVKSAGGDCFVRNN